MTPRNTDRLSPPNRRLCQKLARRHLRSKCAECGATTDLHAHHIDHNWRNNNPENIKTLCSRCHRNLHRFDARITSTPVRKTWDELRKAALWAAEEFERQQLGRFLPDEQRTSKLAAWTAAKKRFGLTVDHNDRLMYLYELALAARGLLGLKRWQTSYDDWLLAHGWEPHLPPELIAERFRQTLLQDWSIWINNAFRNRVSQHVVDEALAMNKRVTLAMRLVAPSVFGTTAAVPRGRLVKRTLYLTRPPYLRDVLWLVPRMES